MTTTVKEKVLEILKKEGASDATIPLSPREAKNLSRVLEKAIVGEFYFSINVAYSKYGGDGIQIQGIEVREDIFNEEKVLWRLEDREDRIENLICWIAESNENSQKTLMLEDLKDLLALDDEYIFVSINDNSFIAQSREPTLFYNICREILELNGTDKERIDELLRGKNNV